jgi:hypothetical protein
MYIYVFSFGFVALSVRVGCWSIPITFCMPVSAGTTHTSPSGHAHRCSSDISHLPSPVSTRPFRRTTRTLLEPDNDHDTQHPMHTSYMCNVPCTDACLISLAVPLVHTPKIARSSARPAQFGSLSSLGVGSFPISDAGRATRGGRCACAATAW